MSLLPLTFAGVDYDRFHALRTGQAAPEGIDLNFLALPVEEIFYRQIRFQEFDVSEMSLSSYVLTLERDDPPFVAIPAFPSRYFRHQTMFVNERSGISAPEDLRGKRVGVPEYQITAGVWQRGMLEDEYGVAPNEMQFFSGGVEAPGRSEKLPFELPEGLSLQPIGPEQTLSRMLSSGELDAIFSASVPSCFYSDDQVRRLFPDYKEVEKAYYRKTGIFPVMHVVVIKRAVLEQNPWVAKSLLKALELSLQLAKESLLYRSSLKTMLPWLADHVEETLAALDEDYWTYGLDGNHKVLETFLRYSHRQGLARRIWQPEDIFAETTSASFVL